MHLTTHAYWVTVLHRVLVAVAASLLVLAVMRRMLPHALAWLVAAWWAVLPVNFDTLYTVHLFSVLPALLAWVAVTRAPEAWGRGTALAILVSAALLVRNEFVVAALSWAVMCVLLEVGARNGARGERRGRATRHAAGARGRPAAYGLPLLVAAVLVCFFYHRSWVKFPLLGQRIREKHALSMAQSYAFGYQQRHPAWRGDTWREFSPLMQAHFGEPMPSLGQMLRRNPRALLEHAAWNVRLLPAGLQAMLFSVTSFRTTPDYLPVKRRLALAWPLSMAALAALAAGARITCRRHRFWWRAWFQERRHGWLAMVAVSGIALTVVPTNRPRPAYLFPLSVTLMAGVATGFFVTYRSIISPRRRRRVNAVIPIALPLLMAGVILAAPNPYSGAKRRSSSKDVVRRPLLETYERLRPHQGLIARHDAVLLTDTFAYETRVFLQLDRGRMHTFALVDTAPAGEVLAKSLERGGVNMVYLDAASAARLEQRRPGQLGQFLRAAPGAGWKVAGASAMSGTRWVLLFKPVARTNARKVTSTAHASPIGGDFTVLNPLGPAARE